MEWDGTGLGDRAIESLRRIHLLIFESIVYYSIGGDGGLMDSSVLEKALFPQIQVIIFQKVTLLLSVRLPSSYAAISD